MVSSLCEVIVMFDVIIIGSGFAGAVMAERLATQQDKTILIIEQRNHIGGNCFDKKDENGILVHRYGPHLFHTNSLKVWKYLSKFTEWQVYFHKVLAQIDGQQVPVPFNLNSLQKLFPQFMTEKFIESLVDQYGYNQKITIADLMKTKNENLKYLAEYINEKFFVHYTEKQWGIKEVASEVTARVPIFIGYDDNYFTDRFQAVPQKGYTELFHNMLNHKNIKLLTNTNFKEVMELKDDKFYFLAWPTIQWSSYFYRSG